jgi:hypothetical protein
MSEVQREFVVTLKEYDLLEEFYSDMESERTTKSFVPSRKVECVNQRPISRNTHYLLTDSEAAYLRGDPRVESVSVVFSDFNEKISAHSPQTSIWKRGSNITVGEKNWGLYRCQLENNISQWGSESAGDEQTATINLTATGKNVDIIIVDEIVYPSHDEYKDRFIQYDWFANHNSTVWPENPNSNYSYDSFNFSNNHATHVAAIVGGNTQGWARNANIYNLRHDSKNDGEYTPPELLIDYIRSFHANKPINPETGRRNPTLVNNSWGLEEAIGFYNEFTGGGVEDPAISSVTYRGSLVEGSGDLEDTGISGVYSATTKVEDISVIPGTGNRIVTTDTTVGTVESITFVDTNKVGLVSRGEPTNSDPGGVDAKDDAFWTIGLPFSISYLTGSYSNVHVSSNGFLTFDQGSTAYFLGAAGPQTRKIFVSAGDRSCKDVLSGVFGTAPNRTVVVRYEGFEGAFSTIYETEPTIIWEMTFYEATPNVIDVHVISNSAYRKQFTFEDLESYGINFNNGFVPIRNEALDADIADAIDEGIIFIGSAGNNSTKIDVESGDDYDNLLVFNGLPINYHRGSSPGASHPDVICVGALDSSSIENKNQQSNTGPRVDIYAPGTNIISAVFDDTGRIGSVVGTRHINIGGGYAGDNGLPGQGPGIAVIITATPHGLSNGDVVTIDDCDNAAYNVKNAVITVVDAESFRFNIADTEYTSILEILSGTVKVGNVYQKWSGSSAAAAQVTGLVALALEKYPWMKQSDAKNYILRYAKENRMFASTGGYTDTVSLQGGNNRIAFFYKERADTGTLIPKSRQWLRPSGGQLYPRPQIRKK